MKNENNLNSSELETVQVGISPQNDQKILLKEKNVNHVLNVKAITHLVCDCYLTTVFTTSGHTYVVAKLLKEFDLELKPYGFVRVNRNTVVNVQHVVSYGSIGNRMVTLSTDVQICISRRGMARLKDIIGT